MARARVPMPEDVRMALEDAGVRPAYDQRPPYQRNDYLGWITAARTERTRRARVERMVSELSEGGVFMGMPHPPSAR